MPFDAGAPRKADLQEVLASFIEKLPKEEFDMSAIMDGRYDVKTGERCGSVGCIAGWASTIPQLVEAGVPKYGSGEYHYFSFDSLANRVADVIGVDREEFLSLCLTTSIKSAKTAAKRIRALEQVNAS